MRYLVFQDEFFYYIDKLSASIIKDWKFNDIQGIFDLDNKTEMVYDNSEINWEPIKEWE